MRRRLGGCAYWDHDAACTLLEQGELIPDDQMLLRLMLGYWSIGGAAITDATGLGGPAERHADVLAAWFPGGGVILPQAYASTGPILGRNRRIYRVGTLVGKRSAARRLAYAPAFIRIFARHLFVFLRVV